LINQISGLPACADDNNYKNDQQQQHQRHACNDSSKCFCTKHIHGTSCNSIAKVSVME